MRKLRPVERVVNVLSIDVEEYFHPTELAKSINSEAWSSLPSFVESQTAAVLDLLATHEVSATFFLLGWVADRYPRLLRKIANAGHEIGCHSYSHSLVYDLTYAEFREDTRRAVRAIEDACQVTPRLYRAPSYSITEQSLWALDILADLGFTHDSSIYPIHHDRYGIPGFGRYPLQYKTASGTITEVPIATAKLSRTRFAPVGGGGYMRLLPYCYTAAGLRYINGVEGQSACVYFHPWELDPNQPRMGAGFLSSFRTYSGLRTMGSKLNRLLTDFQFDRMTRVYPGSRAAAAAVGSC